MTTAQEAGTAGASDLLADWRTQCELARGVIVNGAKYLMFSEATLVRIGSAIEDLASAPTITPTDESIKTAAYSQECSFRDFNAGVRWILAASPAGVAAPEDVPVEMWHGQRKITIYKDTVIRVWGVHIEDEMSDSPRTAQSVQAAFEWLVNGFAGVAAPEAIKICEQVRDRLWADDAKHQQSAGADACVVALRRAIADAPKGEPTSERPELSMSMFATSADYHAAVAAQATEPVAYLYTVKHPQPKPRIEEFAAIDWIEGFDGDTRKLIRKEPLYAAPVAPQPMRLTHIVELGQRAMTDHLGTNAQLLAFARAVEAFHGIKSKGDGK